MTFTNLKTTKRTGDFMIAHIAEPIVEAFGRQPGVRGNARIRRMGCAINIVPHATIGTPI